MNFKRLLCAFGLATAFCLIFAAPPRAQEVVAVLSSKSGAYLEAFSAFKAAYGAEVPVYDLSVEKPRFGPDTRLVAAFGGKASARVYPVQLALVYSMAPGYLRKEAQREGRMFKITMMPRFDALLSKIKIIQPDIRRLGVLWLSPRYSDIESDIKAAGARNGLEVRTFRLENLDALPSLLRTEIAKLDAFWLPPDPLLMNQDTIQQVKNFSWDNGIALYGSAGIVTKEGAVASLNPGFTGTGRTAAAAVLDFLGGRPLPAVIFSSSVELSLNSEGAKKCGITLAPETLKEAAYTFP